MRPSRRPSSSGRNAHASPSMRKGAMIQFKMMLKPIWIQSSRDLNAWCSVSNCTLQRMGYIITSRPIATNGVSTYPVHKRLEDLPIGIETPTNSPLCNAGPTLSTKLPSRTPMIMASRIHRASSRSSHPSPLKADSLVGTAGAQSWHCCSMSLHSFVRLDLSSSWSSCSWSMILCGEGGLKSSGPVYGRLSWYQRVVDVGSDQGIWNKF